MTLRSIPNDFDSSVVEAIDRRLDAVEADHGVRIGLAIESGSRAWGFPSPDSDYDCRFVFVRSMNQYLSPWVRRDVIETPLDAVLDVNGWDLGKALKLVLKGNAVIVEWLQSPISYRGDQAFRSDLLTFAQRHLDRGAIARHYLHLGTRQRRTYFEDLNQVQLKKVFYALRPAAALRWLRMHPTEALVPMHFPTLAADGALPDDVATIIEELIRAKAETRELGAGRIPEEIRALIDEEFARARAEFDGPAPRPSPEAIGEAEALFQRHMWSP